METFQEESITILKELPDKEPDSNNYSAYYNNYLSCQVPPNANSPPSNEFINRYLTSLLINKNLDLNLNTYMNYK